MLPSYFCIFSLQTLAAGPEGSGPQVGWPARCCGVRSASPPPGLPGAVSPALPFPCSVVLRGQEALHCKAAFQDFLQRPSEQDAAAHRPSRGTCGPRGCWGGLGTPPSTAPFQASPGVSTGATRGALQRVRQFPWR